MVPKLLELNVGLYLLVFIGTFLPLLFIFRKQYWNLFDPLILLLFSLAFNVSIAAYTYLTGDMQGRFMVYILICMVAFVAGFFSYVRYKEPAVPPLQNDVVFTGPDRFMTTALIVTNILFITINNLFLLYSVGLGILTGDVNPDLAKVTLSQGGAGIFQKVAWISKFIIVPLCAHAFYMFRMKKLVLFTLAYFVFSSMVFSFSKSGLLFMLFDFSIVAYYYNRYLGMKLINFGKMFVFAGIGGGAALIVLLNVTSKYGVSISELLAERFIATGSGTYQFFSMDGYRAFANFDFVTRIQNYLDVILSTFKLKAWEPLGYMAYMTEYLTGLNAPGFGANPYLFVDGYFLFGWGGILYCFVLGLLLRTVRSMKTGYLRFFIFNTIVPQLFADPGIVQHSIIALLLFVPVYLLIKVVADIYHKQTTITLARI
ncbi:MAG: hypothetical protein H6Q26_483 [Bacteroidetes bacterium]|uniref:hypothetical protein n=1 Tax=unclassified Chitinophaga TaxID=2619133 RepID=UPI0009CF1C1C|nr:MULTISPECIES: hypothetical protein [unclassified Chitinophaga]MBP1650326.1 hypothetical protein [Bacteroidota bacterium]OMP77832.1 hypothetical protein BW716_18105 [[Flexibacter] sp. ATCC 35208]WPV68984.1 hypothetical protein QQL36_09645 [Chitinophaga sp. LS1]